MRNMSFSLTTKQFIDGSKTVTRRIGWWHLQPGDIVMAVEKGMGLKKGEKIISLGEIEIVSVAKQDLAAITKQDLVLEGFPDMGIAEFICFFMDTNNCYPFSPVNRIEFRKIGKSKSKYPDLPGLLP